MSAAESDLRAAVAAARAAGDTWDAIGAYQRFGSAASPLRYRRSAQRKWHLFGRERISMSAVREPFKDAFGSRRFYCDNALLSDNPMDHVLPWSLVGIDGLANLVLACPRCNGDKRHALPSLQITRRRACRRGRATSRASG